MHNVPNSYDHFNVKDIILQHDDISLTLLKKVSSDKLTHPDIHTFIRVTHVVPRIALRLHNNQFRFTTMTSRTSN